MEGSRNALTEDKLATKFEFIDALRGYAVLGVIAVHVSLKHPAPWHWLAQIMEGGQYGVQLFFLASAITLFYSHSRRRHESNASKKYLIRRFFRIAPLYYLAIVFYYLYLNAMGTFVDPIVPITNFLFVHSFYPSTINVAPPGGWSIGVEMSFYLILLVVIDRIKGLQNAALFLVGTLALALVARLISGGIRANHPELGPFFYFYLPNQLYVFALGICAYFLLLPQFNGTDSKLSRERWIGLLGISIFAIVALIRWKQPTFFFDAPIAGFLAVFAVSLGHSRLRLLVNPAICFIGTLSFSIYLVHFAVLDLFKGLFDRYGIGIGNLQTLSLYGIVSLATILIAWGTKHLIEDPGIALGAKLNRRFDRKSLRAVTE